jgi:hypothetical protein
VGRRGALGPVARRRGPRAAGVAALVVGLGLAACGGDGDGDEGGELAPQPHARAPASDRIPELNEAIAERSCEKYAPLNHSAVRRGPEPGARPDARECRELASLLEALEGTRFARARELGTAALLEGRGELRGAERFGGNVTATLLVDRDGQFRLFAVGTGPEQIGGEAAPDDARGFDETARRFLQAARGGDCDELYPLLNVGGTLAGEFDNDKRAVCEAVLSGERFAPAVKDAEQTKPVPLGKTQDLAFYGVPTRRGYFTLLLANQPIGVATENAEQSVLDVVPNTDRAP